MAGERGSRRLRPPPPSPHYREPSMGLCESARQLREIRRKVGLENGFTGPQLAVPALHSQLAMVAVRHSDGVPTRRF
jgi:hypothetical protein